VASLKRKGDTIEWQNDTILAEDEQLSPTFEELIFANVLSLINARLPGHVRNNYYHLIEKTKSLMDHRADILEKVPIFLEEINGSSPVISKIDADLSPRYVFFLKTFLHACYNYRTFFCLLTIKNFRSSCDADFSNLTFF
jgi:hypothetical protein